ncbi:hypothetical protein J2T02_000865 [Chitinophaga terrae (ex Kim and Jung 2007)]|uniref:hypothetical protein n=1 Tax=Chitinophaga terrae (ex Kim and Jung 2007) TaxID=408074 RepID=UPI002783C38D|nr:hypothetical protein [Chitinophaga terrae (ex Kim and Jung 2007)]MDQ0105772.1 hypothetical protein [Chitinophaga terrae (ex Kim and Jung 2007)]
MGNKRKAKLYFSELAMSGVYHSGINSSFIEILQQVFPQVDEIIFTAEQQHLDACKKKLSAALGQVTYKSVYLPKVKLSTLIQRDLLACFYAIRIMFSSRKEDIVFFSYTLSLTHILIVLLNKFLRRQVFFCLHGQMEAFIPNSPLKLTRYYWGIQRPFFNQNNYGYYIVLGDAIWKDVSFLFKDPSRVIILDHPYNYNNVPEMPSSFSPLRCGQIGVGDKGKGTEQIFYLATLLKEHIEAGSLELSIIGKLNPNLSAYDNGLVKYYKEPVGNAEFHAEVSALHYTLHFRNKDQGVAVASGSFFDTVKYCKPYISLDSRFVTSYAERFPGTGIICTSIEDMAEQIKGMLGKDLTTEYKESFRNIEAMKQELSISRLAGKFSQQIRKFITD